VRIILSNSIKKKEFGKAGPSEDDMRVLKRTAKIELCEVIKGAGLPEGAKLIKAYATAPSGAKRVLYMMASDNETLMLLFYRGKDDDLGVNMSAKNPVFKRDLPKRLDMLLYDLESGDYSEIHV